MGKRQKRFSKKVFLWVKDHNIWIKLKGKQPIQLTKNGTEKDSYLKRFHFSPDEKFARISILQCTSSEKNPDNFQFSKRLGSPENRISKLSKTPAIRSLNFAR